MRKNIVGYFCKIKYLYINYILYYSFLYLKIPNFHSINNISLLPKDNNHRIILFSQYLYIS